MTQEQRIATLEAKVAELELTCAYTLHALLRSGGIPTRIRDSIIADFACFAEGAELRIALATDGSSAFREILNYLQRDEAVHVIPIH